MHSSRMRTGRSLTVCCSLLPGGGGFSLVLGGVSAWSRGGGSPWRWGLPAGGVSLVWGVSPWSWGGVCLVPGGFSLVPGGGFSLVLGGSAWSGGSPCQGGLLGLGGVSLVPGGSPETPPRVQNHRHV